MQQPKSTSIQRYNEQNIEEHQKKNSNNKLKTSIGYRCMAIVSTKGLICASDIVLVADSGINIQKHIWRRDKIKI